MNFFATDPHWGWWIIGYFFLGGIAAGAYFTATLIALVGSQSDRGFARVGYRIAFPLILVCSVFLIVDLDRPLRFWHMMLHADTVHAAMDAGWPWSAAGWKQMSAAPLLKFHSPISVGSWAVLLFGMCSFLSFVGSFFRPQGRLSKIFGGRLIGLPLRVVGCLVGFFVAAYTGALLTASNQPLWSDSVWLASLFLTSAASTGIAATILLGRRQLADSPQTMQRLWTLDLCALALELGVFVLFLASLGEILPLLLQTTSGWLLIGGALGLGLLVPLAIHLRGGMHSRRGALAVVGLVLLGGFLLRYAVLTSPAELVKQKSTSVSRETIIDHDEDNR